MAVYVDSPVWEWRGRKWCHLLADSLAELHAFAGQLGLRRSWFQTKARFPHYDITENVREKALLLGAIEASNRTIVTKAIALRTEYGNVMMRNVGSRSDHDRSLHSADCTRSNSMT
jgi:hypothetical protein